MGFCFQWTKCCGFFFLSVDKMLWAFFSTQNELLVVAQHYPHATNRPTRAQRVFSCSARVANRMRRHTDRTVRRRTAEKWKHKKILPFVTQTVVPFDRFQREKIANERSCIGLLKEKIKIDGLRSCAILLWSGCQEWIQKQFCNLVCSNPL